jgi:hypothetical protein
MPTAKKKLSLRHRENQNGKFRDRSHNLQACLCGVTMGLLCTETTHSETGGSARLPGQVAGRDGDT